MQNLSGCLFYRHTQSNCNQCTPKKRWFFSTKQKFSSYTKNRKIAKNENWKIKADTTDPRPRVIPEVEKPQKSDIRLKVTSTYKYKTSSSTKRVNHVTTFKNAPNIFKMEAIEKIKTHIGTDYLARIDPKKDTIAVEPIAKHINCETTGKILGTET